MSGNGGVRACAAGERFFGVALSAGGGFAAVQTKGYVKAAYTGGAPQVGTARLVSADGAAVMTDAGAAQTVTVGGTDYETTGRTYAGGEYLVVDVDEAAGTVGFIL